MTIKPVLTRFRAYQLGSPGSSFSYFDGRFFTLIEARITDVSRASIHEEIKLCGQDNIHTLHITSWDQDHCAPSQLSEILRSFSPCKIEYPGYAPHTDSGKASLEIILSYNASNKVRVTPEYISNLDSAENYGYRDVFYNPKFLDQESSNNNSTVKHFRTGSFNLLSLGDVESNQISARIRSCSTINKETDIMLLAHHGADNGFTTSSFIKTVKPTVAIASADYDNKFEHPKQSIRDLLSKNRTRLFTTKTGDVVAFSTGRHTGSYRVVNLKARSTQESSSFDFKSKKSLRVAVNADTIRARLKRANKGPKRH